MSNSIIPVTCPGCSGAVENRQCLNCKSIFGKFKAHTARKRWKPAPLNIPYIRLGVEYGLPDCSVDKFMRGPYGRFALPDMGLTAFARNVGVTKTCVQWWATEGKIRRVMFRGRWRYSFDDCERMRQIRGTKKKR